MKAFEFVRAENAAQAVQTAQKNAQARYLGGGTNLLDLMKDEVVSASHLIDVSRLPLSEIKELPDGGLSLGAAAKNSDTANHPLVRQRYPLLSLAMLAAASAQIRNMATNGGNLLQRTRCFYFYDSATPCNKRQPGAGCAAREGLNRMHAIFGASEQCVAVHPSDMAVALVALDAKVRVRGAGDRERVIPIADFHRLPEQQPERDTTLEPGELIQAIELPPSKFAARSYYLKVRDRASYAFALISVAAALEVDGSNIKQARLALGGVAHKPWRAQEAEAALVGKPPTEETFTAAAEIALKGAKPLPHNGFKVELARRAIVRALLKAQGIA